jgi:hypothetical protein
LTERAKVTTRHPGNYSATLLDLKLENTDGASQNTLEEVYRKLQGMEKLKPLRE